MSAALSPGDRVGPYLTLFQLGKGGMGEVWAASRPQLGTDRLFALKVLASDRVGENDALMFHDEAKAASALHHAAIVSTIELGQEGSTLFIAMDLVRGPSLTALLQRLVINEDTLSPAMVAHIGVRIGQALDYAFARAHLDGQRLRLVHRDVSPHNVLIDLDGSVRLSDFGVARTAIQDHRSRVGTIRGKPSYMAPEQVAGELVDARTDVFALGIVLYECACLKRLFGRKNAVKSMDAVVRYHPRPLTEMVPGFPVALSRTIERALAKAPAERFPSAGHFAGALEGAARDLDGWSTAEPDLHAKVARNFEADAFDVEAQAERALGLIRRREAREGLMAEVATSDLDPPDSTKTAVWPTSPAPDPLDPEAIEGLRTRLRPTPRPVAVTTTPSARRESYPSFPSGTGFGTIQRRRPAVALLVGAAALMAVVAVGLAVGRSRAPENVTTSPVTIIAPVAAPSPSPDSQPLRGASVEPVPTGTEPSVFRSSPANSVPTRGSGVRARAATVDRFAPAPAEPISTDPPQPAPEEDPSRAPDPVRPEPRRSSEPRPAPVTDATYEEVRSLLRQVRQVDPGRGRAMLATLVEAGRSNVATLNELRAAARSILRRAGHRP